MPEPFNGRVDPVAALASRLRLVQVDRADQAEDARQGSLADEIDRALNDVAPESRAAFLRELEERFPTWEGPGEVVARPQAEALPATPDPNDAERRDPGVLAARLAEAAASMSAEQRAAVIAQLSEAGLAPPPPPPPPPPPVVAPPPAAGGKPQWPVAAAGEVRAKLQMDASDELDPARVLELLTALSDFVCSLDQVVWNTWRTIAPTTAVQRPQALRKTLSKFAANDATVLRTQVTQDVIKLRQLIAALVAAIPQAGRLGAQHARDLAPENIQGMVGTGGFNLEARYWRKYVELAAALDSASVEDQIRQDIAAFAETLVRGTARANANTAAKED